MLSDTMRQCLEQLDVARIRSLWASEMPFLPQPETDAETLVCLHTARTAAESIALDLRCYSHAWLRDRELPSQLPDHLRPRAERMYPRVVHAVGVAVVARSPETEPLARHIEKAMSDAVLEADTEKRLTDSPFVKARMAEARARATKEFWS